MSSHHHRPLQGLHINHQLRWVKSLIPHEFVLRAADVMAQPLITEPHQHGPQVPARMLLLCEFHMRGAPVCRGCRMVCTTRRPTSAIWPTSDERACAAVPPLHNPQGIPLSCTGRISHRWDDSKVKQGNNVAQKI